MADNNTASAGQKAQKKSEVSQDFIDTIKKYLDDMAAQDESFARHYAKQGKSVEDCCTYIINQAYKSGVKGYSSNDVYGMAVHYYVEDKVDVGNPPACRVIVDHAVELSAEEKEAAREEARNALIQKERERMGQKVMRKHKEEDNMQSLF